MGIASRAVLALAAIVVAGCGTPPPAPPKQPPNVLLIVVDTLRADRLGAFGSTRGLTPFLDSVAARGIVFHRAYSSSCWTNPSVGSLFTSRHVWQHNISFLTPLPSAETTLAELLADGGWDTAAWSESTIEHAIHGSAEECIEQLRAHVKTGVDRIILIPYRYEPAQVERVAKEVLPKL